MNGHDLPLLNLGAPPHQCPTDAAFSAACDEYNTGNLAALPRMDVLHDEISRRERSGLLTDNDWIDR
jgi:hypothetical protein